MKKIMFNDRYRLTELTINKVKTRTSRIIRQNAGIAVLDNDKCPVSRTAFSTDVMQYESMELVYPKYKVGEVIAIAQCYQQAVIGLKIEGDYIFIGGTWNPFYRKIYSNFGWKNKMFVRADFMPHQIKITNVRIERLQDISDEDCLKEGIQEYPFGWVYDDTHVVKYGGMHSFPSPRKAFAALIDAVSGTGTWEHNPFVFVYDYDLIK